MRMDRDKRDGARGARIAQPLHHLRAAKGVAWAGQRDDLHQFAVLRPGGLHHLHLILLSVDRDQPPARPFGAEDAQRAAVGGADLLDHPRFIKVFLRLARRHPRQQTVALRQRRVALFLDYDNRRRLALILPGLGAGHQVAISGLAHDLQHRHWRQGAVAAICPPSCAPFQRAFGLHLPDHPLQFDPVRALHAKGAGDVPFRGFAGIFPNPVENVGF